MKKLQVFGISLFLLFYLVSLVSAVRINEVELNPRDECNDCTEWLELYSENEINLTGWKLVDKNDNTMNLNITFSGYITIEPSISLNNNNEKIFLYNNGTLIDETPVLSDSSNDNKTWQYCNENWNFSDSTKGYGNLCSENEQNNNENQNQTQEEPEIYLELEYDKEQEGDSIKVEVRAFNLENKNYDIKIYMTPKDNDTIIAEAYDEEEEKWKSSNYYIDNVFTGDGNKSKEFDLRLEDDEGDFFGDVEIIARIRISGYLDYFEEVKGSMEIAEKKKDEADVGEEIEAEEVEEKTELRNIIRLNEPKSIKTESTGKVYKSKIEYIKEYAIYFFALFCIIFIIILVIKNKKMEI